MFRLDETVSSLIGRDCQTWRGFTNFQVLFPAVSLVLRYQAYIEILNYRDKGK